MTNPTDVYATNQNLLVQTTDCLKKWSFPVSLAAHKSKTFVVSYKLDECSPATATGLESSIEGTAEYGPLVSVTIAPKAKLPFTCNKRNATSQKTPKAPRMTV